jgi:hypothetical protein
MTYGHRPPQLNPHQVQAYLAGWYDLVGPQVGAWGRGGYGPYRGQLAAGINPWAMMGADPGAQMAPPPPMPMAPPPMPMPMAPPAVQHHYHGGGGYPQFGSPDGFPFPARAAVVDAPLPTQANRDILPMSTGVPILPTQSAQITGRPQTLVFKIGRFVISNAGTAGGSADWIVNDIKIGNRSQFVQSGDVPGDLFATNAIDTFVRFESAQTAMDVVVVVTYIGLNESGCPFFGAMVGTAAV